MKTTTENTMAPLAKALAAAQTEFKSVAKDSTNPHFKSKFASLDTIMEQVRPVLARHGLSVVQGVTTPDRAEDGSLVSITVETTLLHESGVAISTAIPMPINNATPQVIGSAVTYGRRYGVCALLALTADDDDDGQSASQAPARAAAPAKAPAASAAPAVPRQNAPTNLEEAAAFLMPMGKSKGTPLSNLKIEDLESALAWAVEKGKFTEFQAAARIVLDWNSAPAGGSEPSDDGLPF